MRVRKSSISGYGIVIFLTALHFSPALAAPPSSPDKPASADAVEQPCEIKTQVTLIMLMRFGKDGKPESIKVASEDPPGTPCADEAREAASTWTMNKKMPGIYAFRLVSLPPGEVCPPEIPQAPAPVQSTRLKYPSGTTGVNGIAFLEIDIADDGSVSKVAVKREVPMNKGFGDQAAQSVGQWKFQPGLAGHYWLRVLFNSGMSGADPGAIVYEDLPELEQPSGTLPVPYPPEARVKGAGHASADLIIHLKNDGFVGDVYVIRESDADAGFGEAAAVAVAGWRFPDGQASTYRMKIRWAAP
jgi:hypothetical protein